MQQSPLISDVWSLIKKISCTPVWEFSRMPAAGRARKRRRREREVQIIMERINRRLVGGQG